MACLGWQRVPGLPPLDHNNTPPQILLWRYHLNVDKIEYTQSTLGCKHQTKKCKLGTKHLFKQRFIRVYFEVATIFKTKS